MLETKNLVKIYKPKKGVPVRALDGVSLKFPDKGMVFLLGKSGSGKSTLLNLLGGLDKYDGGEIIIKNVSSKDFTQQHFDSYRNTYVGFIFQEYNVLEEFTVGANIALALELQGKKATDEELNRILHEVDLDGYGNRRPNELSGGQKQRVAIARALVKNPKIIMADEPTGALDSATGRQVFDTLKKLSAEKLVIVVSHDREFAQSYADRIIELADGKVISDTSLEENAAPAPQGISFEGATAKIPLGYHLTEEDRIAINQYIDKLQSGAQIEFQKSSDKRFKPTDSGKIENSDKSPFALIKSKLSLKHAFKIGASGLKHKKFRLVMTIILSCIAFVLFGLVDTFSSYDHITTCANSIYDTKVSYASVSKLTVPENSYPLSTKMNDADIEKLSKETGISFNGVYSSEPFQFLDNIEIESSSNGYQFYTSYFSGMVEIDRQYLDDSGYSIVAGELPDGGKNEIAISRFMLDAFVKYGYKHAYFTDEGAYDISEKIEIKTAGDIIGKTLMVNMEEYEITAVIDTKFDTSRYQSLMPNGEETDSDSASDQLMDFVLYSEFITAVNNDFTGMMMVGEGFISKYIESWGNVSELSAAEIYLMSDNCYVFPYYGTTLDSVKNQEILWLDGERTELADNEVIISSYTAEANLGAVTYDEFGQMQFDTEMLSADEFTLVYTDYFSGTTDNFEGFKIVGIMLIDPLKSSRLNDAMVFPDKIFNKYYSSSDTVYDTALGIMPRNRGDIRALTEYCYTENDGVKYTINNPVCYELDILNEILDVVSGIFLWIGVGFALFAAVLLSNFIATSISYKKQEIGILRAIGSRGNDVFRIFFAEAFIIAMINFVLSCLGTGAVTFIINLLMRQNVGLLVTVLNFGIRQIGLIFLVSIAVAAIASFLPVKKVASKRPIDAIRNR